MEKSSVVVITNGLLSVVSVDNQAISTASKAAILPSEHEGKMPGNRYSIDSVGTHNHENAT